MNTAETSPKQVELSGRWVVVGMFLFAFSAIGILWFYTVRHTAPFVPLQRALAAEFKDSAPMVEGGQRKSHQTAPKILRIVMKVDFDPAQQTADAERFATRVAQFARQHHDLVSRYELLEIHFFHPEPEKEIKQWSVSKEIAGLLGNAPTVKTP